MFEGEKMSGVPSSSDNVRGMFFNKEIQSMMHAFGDSPTPLTSSVKLVEVVLCEQLHSLINRAREVTSLRDAKCIGVEDILFLMRKDKVKINRLLNYLSNKDLQTVLMSRVHHTTGDIFTDSGEAKKSRRRNTCMEFLESIDQTGEFTAKQKPFDTVKRERDLRAELMSQNMDVKRYLEYSTARHTSFTYRSGNANKIESWLQLQSEKYPELPKSHPLLYEILAYLAFETIAQIIDLSLLVRQDGAAKPGDAFSFYLAGFTRTPGVYSTQRTAKQVGIAPPITTTEIREALRRYWSPQLTPWSPFTRTMPLNIYNKLLVC